MYGPPEREPGDGRITRATDAYGAKRYRIDPLVMRSPGAAAVLALGGSPSQRTLNLTPSQQTGARAESASNFGNLRHMPGSAFQLNYSGWPAYDPMYPLGLSRPSKWVSAPFLRSPLGGSIQYGSR